MRVAIVAGSVGIGLTRDMQLIAEPLRASGIEVHFIKIGRGKLRKWCLPVIRHAGHLLRRAMRQPVPFDLNIMLENVRPELLAQAHVNVLVPNPEYFLERDGRYLHRIDRVFAKTHHAESIFRELGCDTVFTGFTSEDRYDATVARERAFFHLAGRSGRKGTRALLDAWVQHPDWPQLSVVRAPQRADYTPSAANITYLTGTLDDHALRTLQNSHLFHACPSDAEGYGHYIGEALSVGAVVLTCDGPPMNELVRPERGVLIPVARTGRMRLAPTTLASPEEITRGVEKALALDADRVTQISTSARQYFNDNAVTFRERLLIEVLRLQT